jgi:hypothetical protein
MQQWLNLIPIVGALVNLIADITNLTIAVIIRHDTAHARKMTAGPCSRHGTRGPLRARGASDPGTHR